MDIARACGKLIEIEAQPWFKKMKIRDERVISFTDDTIAIIKRTKTTHSVEIRARHV